MAGPLAGGVKVGVLKWRGVKVELRQQRPYRDIEQDEQLSKDPIEQDDNIEEQLYVSLVWYFEKLSVSLACTFFSI